MSQNKKNENDPWTIFEGTIEGFDFVAGSLYKLRVSELVDSDNLTYELIKLLQNQRDPKLRLHDLWSLRKVNDLEIELISEESRPLLEIFISQMTIGGNAGCNNLQAKISFVDDQFISFDKMATTKMMCPDFKIEQQFINYLRSTKQYNLKDLTLILMNEDGKNLLTFRKVD